MMQHDTHTNCRQPSIDICNCSDPRSVDAGSAIAMSPGKSNLCCKQSHHESTSSIEWVSINAHTHTYETFRAHLARAGDGDLDRSPGGPCRGRWHVDLRRSSMVHISLRMSTPLVTANNCMQTHTYNSGLYIQRTAPMLGLARFATCALLRAREPKTMRTDNAADRTDCRFIQTDICGWAFSLSSPSS